MHCLELDNVLHWSENVIQHMHRHIITPVYKLKANSFYNKNPRASKIQIIEPHTISTSNKRETSASSASACSCKTRLLIIIIIISKQDNWFSIRWETTAIPHQFDFFVHHSHLIPYCIYQFPDQYKPSSPWHISSPHHWRKYHSLWTLEPALWFQFKIHIQLATQTR